MSLPFSAVLLAGGKSRRMGTDKALLELDGEVLWLRQLRLLRALEPEQLFIAGPHIAPGCVTLTDAQPGCGPMGGMVAALRQTSAPLLLVLAVDLPRMTTDYLRSLLAGCSVRVGLVPDGQPLAAVYPAAALELAEAALRRGRFSMQNFIQLCAERSLVRQEPVAAEDEPFFLNLNTPQDLSAAAHA